MKQQVLEAAYAVIEAVFIIITFIKSKRRNNQ
jgi:hypothetical protein